MRKPMTKSQLIAALAEKSGMSKKDIAGFWDMFVQMVYDETKEAGQCTLPGIGKMVKQQRKARMGRNPATGESIQIPAKTVCKFRVAKQAKEAIL
jgi:DNA-binding protein HU-beta